MSAKSNYYEFFGRTHYKHWDLGLYSSAKKPRHEVSQAPECHFWQLATI